MLKLISFENEDIRKLQLIIPYFFHNLSYNDNFVKIIYLNYLLEILFSINFQKFFIPN